MGRPGWAEMGGDMEIGLENGAVVGVDGGRRSFALRCLAGCLWLTRTGDGRDYFLEAGQQMEFGRHDSVVVEAWGAARILFAAPVGAAQEPEVVTAWHLVSSP
jgi:hypothetical protein